MLNKNCQIYKINKDGGFSSCCYRYSDKPTKEERAKLDEYNIKMVKKLGVRGNGSYICDSCDEIYQKVTNS